MINRRSMLKIIGLAPAAPAITALALKADAADKIDLPQADAHDVAQVGPGYGLTARVIRIDLNGDGTVTSAIDVRWLPMASAAYYDVDILSGGRVFRHVRTNANRCRLNEVAGYGYQVRLTPIQFDGMRCASHGVMVGV